METVIMISSLSVNSKYLNISQGFMSKLYSLIKFLIDLLTWNSKRCFTHQSVLSIFTSLTIMHLVDEWGNNKDKTTCAKPSDCQWKQTVVSLHCVWVKKLRLITAKDYRLQPIDNATNVSQLILNEILTLADCGLGVMVNKVIPWLWHKLSGFWKNLWRVPDNLGFIHLLTTGMLLQVRSINLIKSAGKWCDFVNI